MIFDQKLSIVKHHPDNRGYSHRLHSGAGNPNEQNAHRDNYIGPSKPTENLIEHRAKRPALIDAANAM